MCWTCAIDPFLRRDDACMDISYYPLNYGGCAKCNKKIVEEFERENIEDDDGENINYKHICSECRHFIADHHYTFKVDDGYQFYSMNCMLCGVGSYITSILPIDPNKLESYF